MTSAISTTVSPSPCISICKINSQTGLCEGCWRTLDEIAEWGAASESVRQTIWEQIHLRIQQQAGFDPE